MRRFVLLALVAAGPAAAADLAAVGRSLRKEPSYRTKAPRYGLLVFGPEARDRVWLVHDGDTLYVDRNGNGDLTDAGERIAANVDKRFPAAEWGYAFEVEDLRVGGKVHKWLNVSFPPLKQWATALKDVPMIRDALTADPAVVVPVVRLEVESARLKGGGDGGRVSQSAGFYDLGGVLRLAARPAAAPIIHFDGPLQPSLSEPGKPLRLGRAEDFKIDIGTPGLGGGTFASVLYGGTIPEEVFPVVEVARTGNPLFRERYELKKRC